MRKQEGGANNVLGIQFETANMMCDADLKFAKPISYSGMDRIFLSNICLF